METIIEILIDNSGSMGAADNGKFLIEGVTRMSLVKKILISEIVPTINYATRIIIRTFHNASKNLNDRACDNLITPIIYEGGFEKEKITNVIQNIKDPLDGGTPITAAINMAVSDLTNYSQSDRKIFLLTDGQENGGGDYKLAAKKAFILSEIPCKIFYVGLYQDEKAEREAREIATGGYINLKTKTFSSEEIRKVLAPLKVSLLHDTLKNIQPQTGIGQSITAQSTLIDNVTEKIDSIRLETQTDAFQRLNELEEIIQTQIASNQKLLSEVISLKGLFQMSLLGNEGIATTTLTIDTEYSEELRNKSEKFVYHILIEKYGEKNVKWLNQNGESGSNHDFEVLNEKGDIEFLIDCKGTPKHKKTFYLTDIEWRYFLENISKYQIYRVYNVENEMSCFCIDKLITSLVSGEVVPYLFAPEVLKEKRVFLTLTTT